MPLRCLTRRTRHEGGRHGCDGLRRRARGAAAGGARRRGRLPPTATPSGSRGCAVWTCARSRPTCSTGPRLRRAMRGAEVVFHTAGYVGSKPADLVWRMNALAPRLVVEAAAAEGVAPRRRHLERGRDRAGGAGDDGRRGRRLPRRRRPGLRRLEARGRGRGVRGRRPARHRGRRPSTPPTCSACRSTARQPGETSTRIVGNYLLGRLPAVVDGGTNIVDVEDVAAGHLAAADRGAPGERYILGGTNMGWVELIDRIAALSGVHQPIVVLPVGERRGSRARSPPPGCRRRSRPRGSC